MRFVILLGYTLLSGVLYSVTIHEGFIYKTNNSQIIFHRAFQLISIKLQLGYFY